MIYLSADHRGFEAKNQILSLLQQKSLEVKDLGPYSLDPDDDYPDFAFLLGETVTNNPGSYGIIICGSGIGVCIASNKVKGIRAGYCESVEHAVKAREDDDTNILVLDTISFDFEKDKEIVLTWLKTPFSGEERHIRRLGKISKYEKGHFK